MTSHLREQAVSSPQGDVVECGVADWGGGWGRLGHLEKRQEGWKFE